MHQYPAIKLLQQDANAWQSISLRYLFVIVNNFDSGF